MIVRDPLPLFPTFARLGAWVAVAAVAVWWVRKRRRQASRRPTSPQGELKRLPASVPAKGQHRDGKQPGGPQARGGSRPVPPRRRPAAPNARA